MAMTAPVGPVLRNPVVVMEVCQEGLLLPTTSSEQGFALDGASLHCRAFGLCLYREPVTSLDSSATMMDSFNDFLLKLREIHEREVEGWQVKVQELSNKKGCDTKRMEELFTRNQQMKEQQRILTDNIKTLENRLRAGLCDRCTVTQEVAKRRQQEFEASHLQSLQHISVLATQMTNLKRENKKLREDVRNLKAFLEDPNDPSNSSNETEGKPQSSPERPPSSGAVALSRTREQPGDGSGAPKTEAEPRAGEAESRNQRMTSQNHLESFKHLLLPALSAASPWKTDHAPSRAAERRALLLEGVAQRTFILPPQALKNHSSLASGEVKASRHLLHAPVPRHPQPIKASPLSIPWPLPESADWMTLTSASASPLMPTSPRIPLSHFPSLAPSSQPVGPRRPAFGSNWQRQSTNMAKEPTVVFRLSGLPDYTEAPTKPREGKESPPPKAGRAPGEGLACEAPLDLSDRGKSKPSQTPKEKCPLAFQSGSKVEKSPNVFVSANSSPEKPESSPSPSSTPPHKQEEDSPSNHKEQETDEPMDQDNKKVPVLTISLRPVVVLESLNSALQKQESLSSNGKALSPAEEPEGNMEAHVKTESDSAQETNHNHKRKRETDNDRDSDQTNIHQERKMKIPVKPEETSSGLRRGRDESELEPIGTIH